MYQTNAASKLWPRCDVEYEWSAVLTPGINEDRICRFKMPRKRLLENIDRFCQKPKKIGISGSIFAGRVLQVKSG
jgi:hypothetical protein